ncbi:MAG: hypothetical protein ACLFT0_00960 [Spirulinaceae cyanobacterium]
MKTQRLISTLSFGFLFVGIVGENAIALPPPEDIPEEVLQMEIITEGVSPLNGEPLTAAEYAELQAQLTTRPYAPEVSTELQQLIFLLRLRRLLNTLIPFSVF